MGAMTKTGPVCPICGQGTRVDFKPFCSSGCADVDLHRWLSEGYRVPVQENDPEPEDAGSLS